jgi:hypothetical protein
VPSILGAMEGCVKAKTLFSGRAVHGPYACAVSIANRRLGANLGVAPREPCRHLLTDTCDGGSIAWRIVVGRVLEARLEGAYSGWILNSTSSLLS